MSGGICAGLWAGIARIGGYHSAAGRAPQQVCQLGPGKPRRAGSATSVRPVSGAERPAVVLVTLDVIGPTLGDNIRLRRDSVPPITGMSAGAHPCAARAVDGTIQMGADLTGPINTACRVLLLNGPKERPVAAVFQNGVHLVVPRRKNMKAQLNGWREYLRSFYRKRVETTFSSNGCTRAA